MLSGRGLCDGLITRPEESYRLWRVVVCDQETSNEEAKARYGAVKNTTKRVGTPRKQTTNNLLTYLHTPWSRVLLEKLTGSQLVKKSPAFYGTQKFITEFTNVRHLSLS